MRCSPYDVLGVSPTATQDELRQAFFGRSREHHPDTNGGTAESTARMKEIIAAYEAVKTPQARAQTNAWLHEAWLEAERAKVPGWPPATPTDAAAMINAVFLGAANLADVVYKVRASRRRERERQELLAATQDARCKAERVDGKRCSNPALVGNYGFCGVHRR